MLSLNYFTLVTQLHFTVKTKTVGLHMETTSAPGSMENMCFSPKTLKKYMDPTFVTNFSFTLSQTRFIMYLVWIILESYKSGYH